MSRIGFLSWFLVLVSLTTALGPKLATAQGAGCVGKSARFTVKGEGGLELAPGATILEDRWHSPDQRLIHLFFEGREYKIIAGKKSPLVHALKRGGKHNPVFRPFDSSPLVSLQFRWKGREKRLLVVEVLATHISTGEPLLLPIRELDLLTMRGSIMGRFQDGFMLRAEARLKGFFGSEFRGVDWKNARATYRYFVKEARGIRNQ